MPIEVESPEELGYDTIECNLAESSVADACLDDLDIELDVGSLLLAYGDHLGDPALRELIAAKGEGLGANDVIAAPGAAAALFCVNTAVLQPGDHAVIASPNYATNLETPRALGADVSTIDLRFQDGWRLHLDHMASLVRPGVTALVSLTCPHNPTGSMLSVDDLHAVIELVERAGAVLLFDETYRDLTVGPPVPMAASLSPRAISVGSLSKAYGLPGLRVGWMACRDRPLRDTLLAAKEQIFICGSTIDETMAARVLAAGDRLMPPIRARAWEHRALVLAWLAADARFQAVPPDGGVVCFARFRPDVAVDVDQFYAILNQGLATYVGPGHWFDQNRRCFRLGFGWPHTEELQRGLANLSCALDHATVGETIAP